MYTANERQQLQNQILAFVKAEPAFECLLQIGSGAEGFADLYSDIDLMAGCPDIGSVEAAKAKLTAFFRSIDAINLDHRAWGASVLGISAYWQNGLSVDISFMPTAEIPIRSKRWNMLWEAAPEISAALTAKTKQLGDCGTIIDHHLHHRFFFALRKTEIAIRRGNWVYAEMMLTEARTLLLTVEATAEGKELHQFKAYHTLEQDFLSSLRETYPREPDAAELHRARHTLLELYVRVIDDNDLCKIDHSQFDIINCFD